MVIKTVLMLSLFFVPLILLNSGIVSTPLLIFALYFLSGLGSAGIGMDVMHDAIHGSYSKNRKVNKTLGKTMNIIGANVTVWKIQHNVLHHNYTNIAEADDDINTPGILRLSPHKKAHWLTKYQHLYVWILYGISTLMWVTVKDFVNMKRYRQMGFIKKKSEYKQELLKLTGWKLLYYTYTLILPMIMLPVAPWIILLAFAGMHFTTGLLLSVVFQTAHVMPGTEYPLPDKNGLIANDWTIHQLATTTNYAPKSRIFSWLIGGLNYQVEHHLLPNICHVHYRKISHIVVNTAQEYGLPYHSKRSFGAALWAHIKMLRQLGKMEMIPVREK